MQKHELFYFEELIRYELAQTEQQPPDTYFYLHTCAVIQTETRRILEYFSHYLFSISDEKEISLGVQAYQQKIVLLIDMVSKHLKHEDIIHIDLISDEMIWKNLYKTIYNALTSLLEFIETEWVKYLDIHAKIPVTYLAIARQKITLSVEVLSAELKLAGADEVLLSLVLQPFNIFLKDQTEVHVTYNKLFYLKILVEGLSELLPIDTTATDINKQIQVLLQELNFNCKTYFHYCTNAMRLEVDVLPQDEQLERLLWMQKQINQIQSKPGVAYVPLRGDLQQQLRHWIGEEIYCLKEMARPTNNCIDSDEIFNWNGFKVITKFSVAQLGHVIKLLVDTGIFSNSNKKQLLDFFSVFFGSSNQEHISPGSLRNHFYNEDATVSAGVREILIRLLNQSQKGVSR